MIGLRDVRSAWPTQWARSNLLTGASYESPSSCRSIAADFGNLVACRARPPKRESRRENWRREDQRPDRKQPEVAACGRNCPGGRRRLRADFRTPQDVITTPTPAEASLVRI